MAGAAGVHSPKHWAIHTTLFERSRISLSSWQKSARQRPAGAKAQWIRSAFADLQSSRFAAVRALVWFDVDKEERWDLHSSQPAFAAWLGALRATGLQMERDV